MVDPITAACRQMWHSWDVWPSGTEYQIMVNAIAAYEAAKQGARPDVPEITDLVKGLRHWVGDGTRRCPDGKEMFLRWKAADALEALQAEVQGLNPIAVEAEISAAKVGRGIMLKRAERAEALAHRLAQALRAITFLPDGGEDRSALYALIDRLSHIADPLLDDPEVRALLQETPDAG